MLSTYTRSLTWVLKHPWPVFGLLLLTVALNFYLIAIIPKASFPQQDTGAITGPVAGAARRLVRGDGQLVLQLVNVIKADPAVANVIGYTGGNGSSNGGFIYIALKPLNERKITAPRLSIACGPS